MGPPNPHLSQINPQMQKPEGYDERRRQRELEKQKLLEAARREARREIDHRGPNIKDNFTEKPNYDYSNRGRARTRSSEEQRTEKKYSRESSEAYSRDSSINRRQRDTSKSADTTKRKVERTRSSSEDSAKQASRRRKKRRESSSEQNTLEAKPASHLRELEFRARALQSLLNKKEETNKAIRRGER